MVRLVGLLLALSLMAGSLMAGCQDVRDFRDTWRGPRVGEAAEVRRGFAAEAHATLVVDRVDLQTISARLTTTDDVLVDAAIQPVPGAEADVLRGITFDGAPTRVYLAFADTADGGGEAVVVVALYDDDRIELRVLRGGSAPLYGIFVLSRD